VAGRAAQGLVEAIALARKRSLRLAATLKLMCPA
jgi:hypothetical protein